MTVSRQTLTDFAIAYNIRRYRQRAGLLQNELAKMLGIELTAMNHIETYRRKVTFAEGIEIAFCLKMDPVSLIVAPNHKPTKEILDALKKEIDRKQLKEMNNELAGKSPKS